ncbi:MAG TPA: ECF transporter S component [Clostridiales bacterium]|nr:ECF transporter S component [Clostridiales bacterium]
MTNQNRSRTLHLTLLAMLSAIIVLMAFTPLGYLKVGLVEITFLTVPVVIGAIILGPLDGAILGAVFGLTSFAQCFGTSAFGAAILGISAVFTFIVCLVPRILIGIISGYLSKWLEKKQVEDIINYVFSSLAGALTNTVFFVGLVILLFGQTDYIQSFGDSLIKIIGAFITTNAVIEAIVCTVLGTVIAKALVFARKKLT